jgi:hypothetical protein
MDHVTPPSSSSDDVSSSVPLRHLRRHDQGPRLTQRDLACLHWIAQQYAIRLDQLQRLLLRYTPQADRAKVRSGTDRLSKERTYKTLAQWDALGLIEYGNILEHEPRWIWLTPKGLREIGSPLRYNKPSVVRLSHLYFTNQVRLWVERRRPNDVWKSEREIKAEQQQLGRGERPHHLPDAILHAANGKTSVIEVELQTKTRDALETIVRELELHYTSILYFCSAPVLRQLQALLSELEPESRKHFALYALGATGSEQDIAFIED